MLLPNNREWKIIYSASRYASQEDNKILGSFHGCGGAWFSLCRGGLYSEDDIANAVGEILTSIKTGGHDGTAKFEFTFPEGKQFEDIRLYCLQVALRNFGERLWSGDETKFQKWMDSPNGGLEDRIPSELIVTHEGFDEVHEVLLKIAAGVCA